MQETKSQLLTIAASLCLLSLTPLAVRNASGSPPRPPDPNSRFGTPSGAAPSPQDGTFVQVESDMTAKTRLFGPLGPGLRAIRRASDGRTYVLASPSPGLIVFDAKGKQLLAIPESAATPGTKPGGSGITFGEDCDIDSDGRMYVADRGSNTVDVFSPDGAFIHAFPTPSPISIAWLGDGEIAVATLREQHLVIVYEKGGRETREFGDPEQISEREDLNRFLNVGELATDATHHLYYGFSYMPEPTVRQFDRNGYAQRLRRAVRRPRGRLEGPSHPPRNREAGEKHEDANVQANPDRLWRRPGHRRNLDGRRQHADAFRQRRKSPRQLSDVHARRLSP